MIGQSSTIRNGEIFNLDINCDGVIWQDDAGWSGCLRWAVEGNTNFVGPYITRMQAVSAVRAEFRACIEPSTTPDPGGSPPNS